MNEKRCTSQEASFYINDLLDTLEIKGNNQLLFNQFCGVLMKYSLSTIKKSWTEIFNLCDLPNGQLAGRLPKMNIIEGILMANRMEKQEVEHKQTKQQIAPQGTISKLWEWGLQYHNKEITEEELEQKIEGYKG